MDGTRWLWVALATVALAAVTALVLAPAARAENDPPDTGGTVTGDWTVNDTRAYTGVQITVLEGSLKIVSGGSLTLENVVLRFDGITDGAHGIDVQQDGALELSGGTNVSSTDGSVHYRFKARGSLEMNNSFVSEVWGDPGSWEGGILIYSDSVSITNSSIFNGMTGGISIFNCSPLIDNCIISFNGQDGQSSEHAYGIYGYNTGANITSCSITDNRYLRMDYTAFVLTKSPTSGSQFWNGNYYSGSGTPTSPWYRYEYYYYTNRTSVFGCGIYLDGGSIVTLAGNTISRNGWAAAGSYTPYTQLPLVMEDSKHQLRTQIYQYLNNNLYGTGIFSNGCTLSVRGNVIDRNGCEPTTSSYYNYQSQAWLGYFWGTGITLVDSGGDLTGNTVSNSVILVNLTGSDFNITDNTLSTDFLQYIFVPQRNAFGIRCVDSRPYIENNTISLRIYGMSLTIDGVATDTLETMVGIELVGSAGVTVESNRITTETYTARNFAAGICLNATMLSGDLLVRNNTMEHKASGNQGGVNVVYSTVAQFSVFSHARLENNIIRATLSAGVAGNVGGGASYTPVVGLAASYGTLVTAVNCTITGPHYGVLVTDFSDIELEYVNISSVATACIRAERGTSVEATGSEMTSAGGTRGIEALGSRVTVTDSLLRNPVEFLLDLGAVVEVQNSTHTPEAVTALDNESYLNVSWPVRLNAVWQDGSPAAGASLVMRTLRGDEFFSALTGPDGSPGPLVWVREYTVHNMAVARYWPQVAVLSLGRASSSDIFMVRSSVSRTLTLIDSIPPALLLEEPAAGARLNNGSVTFRGEASDAETDLADGLVEIKIDQFDWAPVPVVDGFWSYRQALPDGIHTFIVRATDGMGNSHRESAQFTVDSTPPELAVTGPLDGSWTGLRTITVAGVSEPDAVVSVNGNTAGREGRSFSAQLSLEEGQNNITVAATDPFGNTRTVELVVSLDTVLPGLVVAAPANNSFTSEDFVTVRGTSGPSDIVWVNGLPAELKASGFETVVELAEGQNSIQVEATDLAGNVRALLLIVTLDTRAPDLTVNAPLDEDWTDDPALLVAGTVERGCAVTVNGILFEVSGDTYSGFLPLTVNTTAVVVRARDAAGNTATETRTVYLDTQSPALMILSPAEGRAFASRTVTVTGTVDLVTLLTVNGMPVPVSGFVFTKDLTYTSDGTFAIEVAARDRAGNTATASRTVVVDTTAPTIDFSIAQGSTVKSGTLVLTGRTEPFATVSAGPDDSVRADAAGNFTIVVPVEEGQNWIVLTATDPAGNSAGRTLTVTRPAEAAAGTNEVGAAVTGLLLEAGIGLLVATLIVALAWRVARGSRKDEEAAVTPAGRGPAEKAKAPGDAKKGTGPKGGGPI